MEEWNKTFNWRMFPSHETMPGGFEDSSLILSQNQIEKRKSVCDVELGKGGVPCLSEELGQPT